VELVITGVDLFTPVGADAFQSYGAIRAALSRLVESGAVDRRKEPRIVGALPGHTHVIDTDRLATLAADSAARALEQAQIPPTARVSVVLCRPDAPRPDAESTPGPEWESALAKALGARTDKLRLAFVAAGGASFARALERAEDSLGTGHVDVALVGGADSMLWGKLLRWLEDVQRLKLPDAAEGLIPGEAAAFLAVEPAGTRRPPLAKVASFAHSDEPGHLLSDEPCRAEGYVRALRDAIKRAKLEGPVRTLVSDMNGEAMRAREWALAEMRALPAAPELHLHPADCTGDTGAVSGVLGLAIAAIGLSRGELRGPALVVGSGDGPARGVAILEAPSGEPPTSSPPSAVLRLPRGIPPRSNAAALVSALVGDHLEEAGFLLLQRRSLEARDHEPRELCGPFGRRFGWHFVTLAALAETATAPFEAVLSDPDREAADRACALAAVAFVAPSEATRLAEALLADAPPDLEGLILDAACDLPTTRSREWVVHLQRGSPAARWLGARLQARIDGSGEALAEFLSAAEWERRVTTAEALAEASDEKSARRLVELLSADEVENVRVAALRSLAIRGSEQLLPMLLSDRFEATVPEDWLLWARCWLGDAQSVATLHRRPAEARTPALLSAAAVNASIAAGEILLQHAGDEGERGRIAVVGLATMTGVDLMEEPSSKPTDEEQEPGFCRNADRWRHVWDEVTASARGALVRGKPWDADRARRRLASPALPNGVRRLLHAQLRARIGGPWVHRTSVESDPR
jgi:3-oxoacyl-[acyl-carrier-protein] synthase-1